MKQIKQLLTLCLYLFSLSAYAADPIEVEFYTFETDPSQSKTEASVIFRDFSVTDATTLVPLMFSGELSTNSMTVYFNGSELETYSDLAEIQDTVAQFVVDTTYVQGQQADLEFRLTNSGSETSSLAFPFAVHNTEALEAKVTFGNPSSDDGDSGGSTTLWGLLTLLGLARFRMRSAS